MLVIVIFKGETYSGDVNDSVNSLQKLKVLTTVFHSTNNRCNYKEKVLELDKCL